MPDCQPINERSPARCLMSVWPLPLVRRFAPIAFFFLFPLFLVSVPNTSWAEEPDSRAVAQERIDAAEDVPIVTDPETGGPDPTVATEDPDGQIKPPEGYEVISIKGRAVSGIETDVPESVTKFDAESIAALGAGNIADLAKVTPNVEIISAGATTATFFIRGVGLSDFSANATGAVAIYKDDIVMNSPALQLGLLYDLETVDVIKGPAGHGSHRNASAGAFKIYANKPTAEYAAQLRSTFGSYWSKDARDAFIRDTQGFVNLPLIEEALAMRVAFRVRKHDPYMTNGCGDVPPFDERRRAPLFTFEQVNPAAVCGEGVIQTGKVSSVPVGLPTKVGDKGDWAARGALRWQPPGTDMDWLVNFHGSRLDQDSTLGQVIGVGPQADSLGLRSARGSPGYWEPDTLKEYNELFPRKPLDVAKQQLAKNLAEKRPLDRKPYRGDYNRIGKTTLDTWGGHLRGELSLGPIDVTTITAIEDYERFRDADRDFTPDSLFEAITTDEATQFAQELNLSGRLFDSAVGWNLGGAYIEEKLKGQRQDFVVRRGGGTDADEFGIITEVNIFDFHQDTKAFMVYGDVTWDFLEDFTFEIGARLNVEKKDFRVTRTVPSLVGPLREFGSDSDSWSEPTGQIALSYHVNDNVTVHTKYTHGYKAGHFNSNNVPFEVAKPEFIDSFEWSVNVNAFESRVLSRAGFFYYKYKDYQVFVFTDEPGSFNTPDLVIVNASRVEQYGAELELTLKPLQDWVPEPFDGLQLTGRFGWLASQFLDFTNVVFRVAQGLGGSFDVVIDYTGNQLINSPEFKVSGTAEWPFDLGEWGTLTPRYDFVWSEDIFFDPSQGRGVPAPDGELKLPEYALGQRAYWIHNLRLSYRTPLGNVQLSAWVKNILDERYRTYAFDTSQFIAATINFVGEPRSVGGDVTINW